MPRTPDRPLPLPDPPPLPEGEREGVSALRAKHDQLTARLTPLRTKAEAWQRWNEGGRVGDVPEKPTTAEYRAVTRLYDRSGTAGRERLVIAGIGFAEGKTAKQTYAPHGYYAETLQQLPSIFEAFIVEVLSDV